MELVAGSACRTRADFTRSEHTMSFRILQHTLLAATAALAFAVSPLASSAPPQAAEGEIDHLLQYVAASSCTFVRNGTEYPADKAREHLAVKYRFAADRIATAEDFIRYLASGSSLSGEPYHVRCGRSDALSGEWLTAELIRYRNAPRLQPVAR
jgi:hypothetical protein